MHEQERYVGKKLLCVITSLCNHQVKIVLRDIESREKIVNKYMKFLPYYYVGNRKNSIKSRYHENLFSPLFIIKGSNKARKDEFDNTSCFHHFQMLYPLSSYNGFICNS